MGFLSSKTLIKVHALFLFVTAVYLTKSPEVITESDIIFMVGEVLEVDTSPSFSRPQSPFAMCGILLLADALVDLIIVTRVPQIDEILAIAEASRRESPVPIAGSMRMNPFLNRLAGLYSEIWTLLSASRFCLFFAVSFFIYQSKPGAWGADPSGELGGLSSGDGAISALDHLKNRVVFTYGFLEMMFWLWIFLTLREERQAVAARFSDEHEE